MFSREYSLKTRYNFNLVLKRGRDFLTNSLIVKYIYTGYPKRFGIITSSRFSKKAVVQNQARRAISKVVKEKLNEFSDGYYYVFIPKKTILKRSQVGGKNVKIYVDVEEINTEIDTFLSKMVVTRPR